MGGNAFKGLELVRIRREDVLPTIRFITDTLAIPEFTFKHACRSLMGSTGKKETSGDIDFCMNTHLARFVGEEELPVFNKHDILNRLKWVLPPECINTQTFKMGNLMTAWPICGNEQKGLIQVDFVFGKQKLLLFTHFSPSEEESRFPGVFLSQGFGVLAKMNKGFESRDPITGERLGRVGLHLSLEHGLFCSWESRKRPGMGCSKTTPEEFETRFPEAPRFPRIGFIDDPESIVQILLGPDTKVEDVNTFEKLVSKVREKHPMRFEEFKERFCATVKTSGMMKRASPESVKNDSVWD